MNPNVINYQHLHLASEAYEGLGYRRLEVPWWATADIVNVTRPVGAGPNYMVSVNGKALLASGEQGFLYLINKGQLPPGLYQTITPCFRNEPYDLYHRKQFMKLELIDTTCTAPHQRDVGDVALQALQVLRTMAPGVPLEVISTDAVDPIAVPGTAQLDVVAIVDGRQIELGSYGARRTAFATWVYGTGLAEPRFSRTLAEHANLVVAVASSQT